jgi:hypothetical protein
MIKRDFHGLTVEEALRQADIIVGEVRGKGISEKADFIVGHGAIKARLIIHLKEYKLHPEISWANSGVISVYIE